jgi:CBS domain-containing protein
MKVREVMRSEPRVSFKGETLAAAGRTMVQVGCGVLPVVDEERCVVGVITDRDICCHLATRDLRPSETSVAKAMSEMVFSCSDEDEISTALTIMRGYKVRRLPVVDDNSRLLGMLSLDDIVLKARAFEAEGSTAPYYGEVARTLKAIAEHPGLAVSVKA